MPVGFVKLMIQPGDGVERILKGIRKAKEKIELMIFRFEQPVAGKRSRGNWRNAFWLAVSLSRVLPETVDRKELYVTAFNFTHVDLERRRHGHDGRRSERGSLRD